MKPVIGIPLRYEKLSDGRPINYIAESVRRTFIKAGAEIYTISPIQDICYIDITSKKFPTLTNEEKIIINNNVEKCDGIVFPGGRKFTEYDRYILEIAIKKGIPTLGICLGMQLMSCYKDEVYLEKNETNINHRQENDNELTHTINIDKKSRLFDILGKEKILVNSFHNYHATSNSKYKTVATSDDGIIEAIEYTNDVFSMGIQWHPEISYSFDENSKKIIDYFIKEAKKAQENKKKRYCCSD